MSLGLVTRQAARDAADGASRPTSSWPPGVRPQTSILAGRLATDLVRHDPGWRLPRLSVLARRYQTSLDQMATAVDELVAAELVSRLPDGRLQRRSPAEHLVSLTGMPNLTAWVDPMGGDLVCRSRRVSVRPVPDPIMLALGAGMTEPINRVRCLWDLNGQPAAVTNTFVVTRFAGTVDGESPPGGGLRADTLDVLQPRDEAADGDATICAISASPTALHLEVTLVARSLAHLLALPADRPAATLTVRFDDPATRRPVAVSIATLRFELFQIVVQGVDSSTPLGKAQRLGAISALLAGDP